MLDHGWAKPNPLRELALTSRTMLRGPHHKRKRTLVVPEVPTVSEYSPGGMVVHPGRFGSGALLAGRAEALKSIGGFDDDYFLYVEDADLWDRMERSGTPVGFAPDLVASHAAGQASPGSAEMREILRWLGVELYLSARGCRGTGSDRCTTWPCAGFQAENSGTWFSRYGPTEESRTRSSGRCGRSSSHVLDPWLMPRRRARSRAASAGA